jgi:hypothetical protein
MHVRVRVCTHMPNEFICCVDVVSDSIGRLPSIAHPL